MLAAGVVVALMLSGCGGSGSSVRSSIQAPLPADYVPVSVGPGPLYRPALPSARARLARTVDGLRCDRRPGPRFGAHLEVFAHQHVVAIPAGIGLAPPLSMFGATVRSAYCSYPAITADPTGVIDVRAGARVTLGQLFDLWGQPLGRTTAAGFSAPAGSVVIAFVNGRRWRPSPRKIPLSRHVRITLELASHILPHRGYLFPPGL